MLVAYNFYVSVCNGVAMKKVGNNIIKKKCMECPPFTKFYFRMICILIAGDEDDGGGGTIGAFAAPIYDTAFNCCFFVRSSSK